MRKAALGNSSEKGRLYLPARFQVLTAASMKMLRRVVS
jgi:hypothetical protein